MKKIIIRTVGLFLIIYLFGQITTFLLFNDIPIKNNVSNNFNFSTTITYLFSFVNLILAIVFLKITRMPYNLIHEKINFFGKLLFSFTLLYLSLLLLDPINKEFNTDSLNFTFNWENWNGSENDFIILLFLGPIFEELFFRQILLKPFLKDKKKMWFGIIITTFLFAISHFYIINSQFNINYFYFSEMIIFGFILSIIRIKYGLIFSIIAHILYNSISLLYKENIVDLFYLDYINNEYLFWGFYLLTIIFVASSIVYITKSKTYELIDNND